MQNYVITPSVAERVLRRKGRPISIEAINPAACALVVVDMQNHFVAEGFPSEVPQARDIVPKINLMAKKVREAGGKVIWIQTTATGALEHWEKHHNFGLTAEVAKRRLVSLDENAEGFKLFPALEVEANDIRIHKIMFSAIIECSSNLRDVLRENGIEFLLIAGTTTNVCCESTGRDAMMMDYRVAMLSDCCATRYDEEHTASLNNFQLFFGDVMTADQAIARLE
ncbi:cysteine hydrolase [Oxalobacteraceae bacterium CAVE-383]|nr:cysteine hydrolase [Oxalobacteraceae bacterium CAVE-383]